MEVSAKSGRYVALGSSFAAGPGLMPRAEGSPRRSGRSAANYAHLLAAHLGLALDDVSFSGATTSDILAPNGRGFPAQLDSVRADTELVTMTAGGNDVGYLPALTGDSLPYPFSRLPRVKHNVAEAIDPRTLDERFDRLERNLTAIVRRIRDQAPDARVVLVDYLTILPPDPAVATGPLSASVADGGRHVADRLGRTTEAVASAEGCTFLPVGEASRDHHAWAVEPWTRRFHLSLRGGAPYHPNADGMRAIAGMLADLLETV